MKRTILITMLSAGVFTSCSKSQKVEAEDIGELKVEVTGVSGGCGNFLNIQIDKSKTIVTYPSGPCKFTSHTDRSYSTTAENYSQLVNYIQTLQLQDAKINDCYRCADGDDYIITIKSSDWENQVTIGGYRSDEYKEFVEFLKQF